MDDPAHIIDDLLRKNARLRNNAGHARSLLLDAMHALEHGHLDVVAEFLDRSVAHLDTPTN